jgi:hypothetical protein
MRICHQNSKLLMKIDFINSLGIETRQNPTNPNLLNQEFFHAIQKYYKLH